MLIQLNLFTFFMQPTTKTLDKLTFFKLPKQDIVLKNPHDGIDFFSAARVKKILIHIYFKTVKYLQRNKIGRAHV